MMLPATEAEADWFAIPVLVIFFGLLVWVSIDAIADAFKTLKLRWRRKP